MPDSTDYYLKGTKLTPDAAEKLEFKLSKKASDMKARCQLIGYYRKKQFGDDECKTKFAEHVLWIVEHEPEHEIASSSSIGLSKFINCDYYDLAKKLWLKHLENDQTNLTLLENAAKFFILEDKELAQNLYRKAHEIDPRNPRWPSQLSHAYELDRNYSGALAQKEKAYNLAIPEEQWYYLKDLPCLALSAGDHAKAEVYSNQLIDLTNQFPESDRLGEFLHSAHITLAAVNFAKDDKEKTKSHLLKSWCQSTTDSRPLWWMTRVTRELLQKLLDVQETDCVIEFLQNCRDTGDKEPCFERWIDEIKRGVIPDINDDRPYRGSLSKYMPSEQFWNSLSICRNTSTQSVIDETGKPIQLTQLWEALIAIVEHRKDEGWSSVSDALRQVPLAVQRHFARQDSTSHVLEDTETGVCMVDLHYPFETGIRRLVCMFHKNVPPEC